MDATISDADRAHLMQRYKMGGNGPAATVQYAIEQARDYAETYGRGMPLFVRQTVAQLHVRYLVASDRGTKMEIRTTIDLMLQIGRGCMS